MVKLRLQEDAEILNRNRQLMFAGCESSSDTDPLLFSFSLSNSQSLHCTCRKAYSLILNTVNVEPWELVRMTTSLSLVLLASRRGPRAWRGGGTCPCDSSEPCLLGHCCRIRMAAAFTGLTLLLSQMGQVKPQTGGLSRETTKGYSGNFPEKKSIRLAP